MSNISSGFYCIVEANIIDGTGNSIYSGDVYIEEGKISKIVPSTSASRTREYLSHSIIEANCRYLSPGFIDAHCHDDLIFLRQPERPEKVFQGVTTTVVGNCSFSLYPTSSSSQEYLRQHFSTLLGQTNTHEVFSSFSAYKSALHTQGISINLVSLVGHAALRLAIIGLDNRPATNEERISMQLLLGKELKEGAAGLSLGLGYPPSAYADRDELLALCETVYANKKIVAAHIRSYSHTLIESTEEFLDLLRSSRASGLLSHLQAAGRPNWNTVIKVLRLLEQAREEGIDISFDMYPYTAGSSYMLQLIPPKCPALEGGISALLKRLTDPNQREMLRKFVEEQEHSKVLQIGWENVVICGVDSLKLKEFEGKSMTVAASESGMSPFDLFIHCIEEDQGQSAIVLFQLDESDVRAACTHPLHMFGSDGLPRIGTKPHPRAFGTFPRVVGKLSKEWKWFSMEDSIRRMTLMPAQRFGLEKERGTIEVGKVADLILFNESIMDLATFDNPTALSQGIDFVWVAGKEIVREGKMTGIRPGQVL